MLECTAASIGLLYVDVSVVCGLWLFVCRDHPPNCSPGLHAPHPGTQTSHPVSRSSHPCFGRMFHTFGLFERLASTKRSKSSKMRYCRQVLRLGVVRRSGDVMSGMYMSCHACHVHVSCHVMPVMYMCHVMSCLSCTCFVMS